MKWKTLAQVHKRNENARIERNEKLNGRNQTEQSLT